MNNIPSNPGHRYKKITYNYDLISGKVNQVSYQAGKPDAYYHRYEYDAENRLTQVYSGRDSIMLFLFPEREASYEYYAHGPLARTVLGKLNVQGLDHAYTLQGWLKGINPAMGGSLTNGTDTTEAKPVAQDVFGFNLHYYNSDYKAIWFNPQASSVIGSLGSNAAPLYNGNIAAMAVNIPKLSATKVYNYKYDQLNRLVAMDMFNGLNPVAGTFTASISPEYRERISYDPNGNIKSYLRNGDAARQSMDNLSYHYKTATNQLHKVYDSVADVSGGTYANYLDLQTNQADNNYKYDAIGNLIKDSIEKITNITWNVYGKIESITQNGKLIQYTYDAAGNRIIKATSTDTTYYVRDASGNVLSVYRKPASGQINQEEVHLYGSSRLGIVTRHLAPDSSFVLANSFGKIYSYKFTRGEKLFELSNHLGNVLVTLSDRVQQVKVTSDSVRYYLADIRSANDYYPFGMLMPGRKFNAGSFRYGFNGKENDNEVKGTGNQQDYGMRIYDVRIGRFLSIDPAQKVYPWYTPYHFAGNNPIAFIDVDGENPGDGSEKYVRFGVQLTPAAAGFVDGLMEGISLVAAGKLAWNLSTDQNFREQFVDAIKTAATDPVGFVKTIAADYKNKFKNMLAGTEEGQYEMGSIVGEFIGGALTGGAAFKLINYANKFKVNVNIGMPKMDRLYSGIPLPNIQITIKRFPTSTGKLGYILQKARAYQAKISGGNADIDFKVGKVSFDGYDKTRNVLLEAKFGHGDAIFDNDLNIKDNSRALGRAKGLLDQANRQIDAASGTQIEWHISSKKGAEAIRKIFKDARIDESKIKVIHTEE